MLKVNKRTVTIKGIDSPSHPGLHIEIKPDLRPNEANEFIMEIKPSYSIKEAGDKIADVLRKILFREEEE